MSLRTPICDLFEIEHPVFLAGMGGVAYAEVCAAVSEAGGYGTLGMASCPPEQIRSEMRAVRARSGKPFGVDLLAALPEARAHQGEILRRCAELVDRGELRVEVQQSFPLEQAAEAHRLLEQGHLRGKLVLRIGD